MASNLDEDVTRSLFLIPFFYFFFLFPCSNVHCRPWRQRRPFFRLHGRRIKHMGLACSSPATGLDSIMALSTRIFLESRRRLMDWGDRNKQKQPRSVKVAATTAWPSTVGAPTHGRDRMETFLPPQANLCQPCSELGLIPSRLSGRFTLLILRVPVLAPSKRPAQLQTVARLHAHDGWDGNQPPRHRSPETLATYLLDRYSRVHRWDQN